MSEPPKEIFLCKQGWDLFDKWLKGAQISPELEARDLWAEYWNHKKDCKECQELRKKHGN